MTRLWALLACVSLLIIGNMGCNRLFSRVDVPPNEKNIEWHKYSEGEQIARDLSKPMCIVMYATWCGVCEEFWQVFYEERLVEATKQFVMVYADVDNERSITKQFAPDGYYVPRVVFVDPAGNIMSQIVNETRDGDSRYGYGGASADDVIASMSMALGSLGKP